MSFKFFLRYWLSLILLSIFSSACSDDDGVGRGITNIRRPPAESPPPDDGESPEPGEPPSSPLNDVFAINVGEVLYTTFVNSDDGWGSPCEIRSTEAPGQNMDCYIDALEGSIFARDLILEVSAPGNMCEHMTVSPPWHWNFSTGIGPKQIILDYDQDNNLINCQAQREDDTVESCADNIETIPNGDQPLCIYDHSLGNTLSRPNCCFGEYLRVVNRDTNGDGSIDTTDEFPSLWNNPDNIRQCLGGPTMVSGNWSSWGSRGYPTEQIFSSQEFSGEVTIGTTINMQANVNSLMADFSYQANFFTRAGTPHAHGSYANPGGLLSELPYALDPIDDLDESPFGVLTRGVNLRTGQAAWEVACLDAGFETKHRINVYVREWNTLEDFLAYEDSEGLVYNPNRDGTVGVDCGYSSSFGGTCNDFRDLDDLLPGSGYDLSTPNPTARQSYFPGAY